MRKATTNKVGKRKLLFFAFIILFLLLFFFTPYSVYCQSSGFKYFRDYNPREYGGQAQNWSILQDKQGVIYVGNQLGLLEFDGVSWRKINVRNHLVNSLAIDETGTIYVGGLDEIGFLAPDAKGTVQYESLLKLLDINKRRFSYVWETHWTKQGIYFRTSNYLFRCDPNRKKINVWESENMFHTSFICQGMLFIRQENVGLMKMDTGTDSLKLIPGGEIFADKKIYMMAPYDKNIFLIATRANGFYTYDIYDGIKAIPFPAEVGNFLNEKKLSHGIGLSTGDYALATLRGGLVIIDSQCRLKEIINKTSNLQDDNVNYVFEDCQGNLWLALDQGISKIEYGSPFSIYDDRSHLPGIVLTVVRHKKSLYAGTTRGLYVFDSSFGFRPVAGISTNCWSLLSVEDSLIAATTEGVFQVNRENNSKHRVIKNRSYFLLRSNKEPNRIWVGTREGLISLYSGGANQTGKWKGEHQFLNITPEIRIIVEEKNGSLWLGTKARGVLKVDFPDDGKLNYPVVTRYHTLAGLPPGGIRVFSAVNHVMFATDKGIYRFDEVHKRFIPDSMLGDMFANGSRGVFRIVEDNNKNVWLHSDSRNFQAIPLPDGTNETYVINKKPFLRIPDAQVNTIYPDPDDHFIWFASTEGLLRYDLHHKKNYKHDFPTLLRNVTVDGNLVFAGFQSQLKGEEEAGAGNLFPVGDFKERNFCFEFAAPFFEDETNTQYQCLLEGYDDQWTDLAAETRKHYTNLHAGLYTFRVRAKNIYGNYGREAVFRFNILHPWYSAWWAYWSYAFLLFMLMYLIIKWQRSYKLEKEKYRLEQIVKERTREIKEKNLQLEEQSEKLKEMDKLKSRFFANISHEFRTPLALIMGPLEQMLAVDIGNSIGNKTEWKKKLNLMLRNSHRLLDLINQLLELSKFENGKVKLQASQQNIVAFLRGTVASFDPVANKNELDLTFCAEEEHIEMYFDPGKLEEIIFNLLSNAVKFTPMGGQIIVKVTKHVEAEENFPSGRLEISVRDSGPGIPGEQLAYIFNRFYQLSNTYENHRKGSGIGLAIVKELVELHHGHINAQSNTGENSGTEFIISLPLEKAHLKPEEIVEPTEQIYKHKNYNEIPGSFLDDEDAEDTEDVDSAVNNGFDTPMDAKGREIQKQKKNIILLVEDSIDFRDYIRGALVSFFTVIEAKDGREGIQKAQKIIPDLIISDIMMPEVDGYELCRVIKKDAKTSHIPIILLTAKASEESIIQGLEIGADDYITKPFNTKILYARIKNLIDLRLQMQLKRKREMSLQPTEISVSSVDDQFYKELQEVIEKNLSNSEFNVAQLGKKLYMSRATLYRKIMALTDESPHQFIRSYRLKRAAQLLKANFGNVTEVAAKVGFTNMAYFSQCFKEKFHQLPSAYQASHSESLK